jgi:hypothetical protein
VSINCTDFIVCVVLYYGVLYFTAFYIGMCCVALRCVALYLTLNDSQQLFNSFADNWDVLPLRGRFVLQ